MTGWDPQGYVPFVSGYLGVQETPLLHDNGCENCHGPGSRHVAFENGDLVVADSDFANLEAAYRQEMRLTLEEAKTTKCFECHDVDNSPDFQAEGAFEEYWELVKHNEEDE